MNYKLTYSRYAAIFIAVYFVAILVLLPSWNFGPDEGTYLLLGHFYKDTINFALSGHSLGEIYDFGINYLSVYPKLSVYYPPLYQLIVGLTFDSEFGARLISLVAMCLALFMTFLLGKEFLSERASLLSMMTLSVLPLFVWLAGAAVTESLMFLLFVSSFWLYLKAFKTDDNRYYALGAVAFALSIMTKWFAFPLMAILLFYAVWNCPRKVLKKFLLSCGIAFVILIPYILLSLWIGVPDLIEQVFYLKFTVHGWAFPDNPPVLTVANWLWYPANAVVTLSLAAFALVAFVAYVVRKEKDWKLLLLWVLVSYLTLSAVQNKETRYLMTFLPPIVFSFFYFFDKAAIRTELKTAFVIFLIVLQATVSYSYLASSGLLTPLPVKEIASYLYANADGNVAFLSEDTVYSSPVMYELSKLDTERKIMVFRPCLFFNKTAAGAETELARNGIHLVVVAGSDNTSSVVKDGNFTLMKSFGKTDVYSFNNFKKVATNCNYVCLTEAPICKR